MSPDMPTSSGAQSLEEAEAEAQEILSELNQTYAKNQLKRLYHATAADGNPGGPYDWQAKFHNLGADFDERGLLAANRVGKTRTCAAEVAMHAIGWYPSWYSGKKFSGPVEILFAGQTNELARDIQQKSLFGKMEEGRRAPSGEGWIPADRIGKFSFRRCNVDNVMDECHVRHASGGWSLIKLKTYEQGVLKFEGGDFNVAWMDEEPENKDKKIFSEVQTRLLTRNGILLFSRTPLKGMTEIVKYFMSDLPGVSCTMATWDQAPHITLEVREKMLKRYPEHERLTRMTGIPMLGEGAVYDVPDEVISCDPFEIPAHYRRICGVDFGIHIDHPAAASWLAHDADTDVVYLYDCYKASNHTAVYHAQAIKGRGAWIPVAWPHDGLNREKGESGKPIKDSYEKYGVNMIPISARYDDQKGSGQGTEPIVMEMLERMRTGRFKVFRHLEEWKEEKRMYHRENGVIVKRHEDLLSSTHYAAMMLRYARANLNLTQRPQAAEYGYDPLGGFVR